MSYKNLIQNAVPTLKGKTPESEPLSGQVQNEAGGYYFAIDPWAQLDRFLILGTDSGTYYVNPVQLTKENAQIVQTLLKTDGVKVVARIVEVSVNNLAPKNDSALFALALAASCDDQLTRQAALANLHRVARTGSYLLQFAGYINHLRGWGRALRKAVAAWFTDMSLDHLTLQAIKYEQREGWSLRDLLRLSHPKCIDDPDRATLFNWIVKPKNPEAIAAARKLRLIEGKYQTKETASVQEIGQIVRTYSLPREALPTEALNSQEVWDALLVDMPMTAMIRNLGKMSEVGLLQSFHPASQYVVNRLGDQDQLFKARISPFHLLLALRTYARGKGVLGSLTWTPVPSIVTALDEAFELSFATVIRSNKRILVGIDVSGSMQQQCNGSPVLSAVEAAAAVASFLVRTEKEVHTMAFDTEEREFPITPNQRLDDIILRVRQWGGGTDLSLPVTYALKRRLHVDAIIILTDNECWAGRQHNVQALNEYRSKINPKAKLVVMATSANGGIICDPQDPLSLGVVGFDASAPQVAMDFIGRNQINLPRRGLHDA